MVSVERGSEQVGVGGGHRRWAMGGSSKLSRSVCVPVVEESGKKNGNVNGYETRFFWGVPAGGWGELPRGGGSGHRGHRVWAVEGESGRVVAGWGGEN